MADGRDGVEPHPGLAPDSALRRGTVLFTLDVEDQLFEVSRYDGGIDYVWLTGPNDGYGFSMSGVDVLSEDEHREHIRGFLRMIDPATGYIADD